MNNIKYLEVTLIKQVKELYDESFQTLRKEIEHDMFMDEHSKNSHPKHKLSPDSMQ